MASRKASWWVLSEAALLTMLRRAGEGDDPELILLEEYANCEHREDDDA